MFGKRKSEKENEECVTRTEYALCLRFKNWAVMLEEAPCRWKIQVSSNLEQVVEQPMSWLIK